MFELIDEAILRAWFDAPPDRRRVMEDSGRRADSRAAREREWIHETCDLAECLSAGDPPPFAVPMFWIRLYGTLHEVAENWKASHELRDGTEPPNSVLPLLADICARAIDARHALTEGELVCVDFFRLFHAHVRQDSYSLRWNQKGQAVIDRRAVALLDRAITIAEAEAFLRAELRHATETDLAARIAQKALEPLKRVRAARERIETEDSIRAALAERAKGRA